MTAPLLARRHVVLMPFPFSDLSAQKLRPALVLADAGRGITTGVRELNAALVARTT